MFLSLAQQLISSSAHQLKSPTAEHSTFGIHIIIEKPENRVPGKNSSGDCTDAAAAGEGMVIR
jgi:hypothetical protein